MFIPDTWKFVTDSWALWYLRCLGILIFNGLSWFSSWNRWCVSFPCSFLSGFGNLTIGFICFPLSICFKHILSKLGCLSYLLQLYNFLNWPLLQFALLFDWICIHSHQNILSICASICCIDWCKLNNAELYLIFITWFLN